MKPAAFIVLALLTVTQANATPPAKVVSGGQQAHRDNEKLAILQTELTEQRQQATQLQQQRAVDLQSGNTEALAKTEENIEEVTANITQIEQEIKLAQGQSIPIKPVSVRLTPVGETDATKTARQETEPPIGQTGQWWDLYNQKRKQ